MSKLILNTEQQARSLNFGDAIELVSLQHFIDLLQLNSMGDEAKVLQALGVNDDLEITKKHQVWIPLFTRDAREEFLRRLNCSHSRSAWKFMMRHPGRREPYHRPRGMKTKFQHGSVPAAHVAHSYR